MNGPGFIDGLAATAIALAVILSAIVSLIGASARRRNIDLKAARAQDLCELTGITDPKTLQDVFGPPDMGRVWRHVDLKEVLAARRPLGLLISDPRVDWACMLAALTSFFSSHALVEVTLMLALAAQAAGWIAAARLPR